MGKELTVEQIRALMESVAKNQIGELCIECDGLKLKIKGKAPAPAQAVPPAPPAPVLAAVAQPAPAEPPKEEAKYLTSPIVGTFYASSAPDKDPFVSVGGKIAKGQTAFIIESMKVMNEVPSELDGTVCEVLVKSGDPVEYGQPVMRLE